MKGQISFVFSSAIAHRHGTKPLDAHSLPLMHLEAKARLTSASASSIEIVEISYFNHRIAFPNPTGIALTAVRCAICGLRCVVRSRGSVVLWGVRYARMTFLKARRPAMQRAFAPRMAPDLSWRPSLMMEGWTSPLRVAETEEEGLGGGR
jgi:hypothetical protein